MVGIALKIEVMKGLASASSSVSWKKTPTTVGQPPAPHAGRVSLYLQQTAEQLQRESYAVLVVLVVGGGRLGGALNPVQCNLQYQ
jgi:hypothetical protein